MSQTVNVTLGGENISVVIDGGNMGAGASVGLQELNQAVGEAKQAADDAEASANQAAQAVAGVPAIATAAGTAAGSSAGAASGAAAAGAVVATRLLKVPTLSDLRDVTDTEAAVFVRGRASDGDGYAGEFEWIAGDQSANVSADTSAGVWVAPDGEDGSLGAWKRVIEGNALWLDWFGAGNSSPNDDQAAWDSATAVMRASGIKELRLTAQKYYVTDTNVIPAGSRLIGSGKYDNWEQQVETCCIVTYGAGNPKRWTDIDGSDAADDTPVFVAGGNGVYFENITLLTGVEGQPRWSAGLFFPSVKQCGYSNVQAFGFTDGCIYLDATWSSRNTTLQALHPLVEPSTGMNEFKGDDCYARAWGAGFAVKIQGTTRAYDAMTPETWMWGPGGTSDVVFTRSRFGHDGGGEGGLISGDAQFAGLTAFSQGVTFRDVALRMSDGRYVYKFDRVNRWIFDGCYGEVFSGAGEVAVTSRTQSGGDGIIMANDKSPIVKLTIDGVEVPGTGMDLLNWAATRCIKRYRADGRIFTQNIDASTNNRVMRLTSFEANGTISLCHDDGVAQTPFLLFAKTAIRPQLAGGVALGTSSYPFVTGRFGDYVTVGDARVFHNAGSPEGSVSTPPGSICLNTSNNGLPTYKRSGTGNTGYRTIQIALSGTTANRPAGVSGGFQYFDTTLGKPVFYSGSGWVDATGASA